LLTEIHCVIQCDVIATLVDVTNNDDDDSNDNIGEYNYDTRSPSNDRVA